MSTLTGNVSSTVAIRQEAKRTLAAMVDKEFGVSIHPNHLGFWLKENWTELSTLAHIIKDVPSHD